MRPPTHDFETKRTSHLATILGVVFLLAILAPVYVYLASQNFMWMWDERLHVLVARNFTRHWLVPTLIDNPILSYDYKDWLGNHIWLAKPPLGLWIGAVGIKLFGASPLGYHSGGIVLLLLCVLFAYLTALRVLPGIRYALLAAWLEGTSYVLVRLVTGWGMDLVDLTLAATLHMGLYFAVRYAQTGRGAVWVGIASGLGFLTKLYLGLVPFAVLFLIAPHRISDWVKAMAVAAGIALPWNLFALLRWPDEYYHEHFISLTHLWRIVERHGPWKSFYASLLPYYANIGVLIVITRGLWKRRMILFEGEARASLALLAFLAIPFVVLTGARSKLDNFILLMTPPFSLWLSKLVQDLHSHRLLQVGFLTLILGGSACNLMAAAWQADSPSQRHKIECAKEVVDQVKSRYGKARIVLFHTERLTAEPLMVFGDFTAYRKPPKPDELDHISRLGYKSVVLGHDIRPNCFDHPPGMEAEINRRFILVGDAYVAIERFIKAPLVDPKPVRVAIVFWVLLFIGYQAISLIIDLSRQPPPGK